MRKKTKTNFTPLSETDWTRLPSPLYQLLVLYDEEKKSELRKVNRLIDAIEWAVKWHTLLVISDLLREQDLPKQMKVMLSAGLQTPSLGTWVRFFREGLTMMSDPLYDWKAVERLNSLEERHQLVAFRNKYAHGATPDEMECHEDCERYFPVLLQLIGGPLFTDIRLIGGDDETNAMLQGPERIQYHEELVKRGQLAALIPPQENANDTETSSKFPELLSLWPIAFFVEDERQTRGRQFYYFNAIKSEKIEQLNYEWSSLLRDKQLYERFEKVLPLREWRKIDEPDLEVFRFRMEALRENFKGRVEERRMLKEFCLLGCGTLMLWGEPGIGKSALIAQVFEEMKGEVGLAGQEQEREYPPVIQYFIKRGTVYAEAAYFLRYLNGKLDKLYGLKGCGQGETVAELHDQLIQRLDAISDLQSAEPLVLFLDGLDEEPQIHKVIPESRPWMKVVVSSRLAEQILNWYRSHDRENRRTYTIGKLSMQDIRAILYTAVDRYQAGFNQAYVRQVTDRSGGNPLYLKLLCEQIFENGGTVGKIAEIPHSVTELYAETIKRLTDGGNNEEALQLLILYSVTYSALPNSIITNLLAMNTAQAASAVDSVRELLFEDPASTEKEAFQLFHESLREWIEVNYRRECLEMRKKVAKHCFSWQQIDEPDTLRYVLEYGARHLSRTAELDKLWQLLQDELFREKQIGEIGLYRPALDALQVGVEAHIRQNGQSPEDDGRLAWLVMRLGQLGQTAKSDVSVAFEWFRKDPQNLELVLKRLEILDEAKFYQAAVLLLWTEADRQVELSQEKRSPQTALRIFKEVETRVPPGRGTVDWHKLYSEEFMVWWTRKLRESIGDEVKDAWLMFVARSDSDETRISWFGNSPEEIEQALNGMILELGGADGKDGEALSKAEIESLLNDISPKKKDTDSEYRPDDGDDYGTVFFPKKVDGLKKPTGSEEKGQCSEEDNNAIIEAALKHIENTEADVFKGKALCGLAVELEQAGKTAEAFTVFERALDVAKRLESLDASNSLRDIAKALGRADGIQKRPALLERVLELAEGLEETRYKIWSLCGVAATFEKSGDRRKASGIINKALLAAQEIKDDYWKSDSLMVIAEALVTIEADTKAHNLFIQALSTAHELEVWVRRYCIGHLLSIATVLTAASDESAALIVKKCVLSTAEFVQHDDHKAEALNSIVKAFGKMDGMRERAEILSHVLKIAERIKDSYDKSSTLSDIAAAFEQVGNVAKAHDAFNQAVDAAEEVEGWKKPLVLCSIAEALAQAAVSSERAELFARVLEIAERIENTKDKSDALRGIAAALEQAGEIAKSNDVFNLSMDAAERIEEASDRSLVLWGIAEAIAKTEGFIERSEMLFRVSTIAEGLENWIKSNVLCKLFTAFEQAGEIVKAHDVLDQAIDVAEEMEEAWDRSFVLCGIAEAIAKAEELREPEEILSRVLTIADGVKDSQYRADALYRIAVAFEQAGQIARAHDVLDRAIDVAETINDGRRKFLALYSISEAPFQVSELTEAHDVISRAIDVAERIKEEPNRSEFFRLIVKSTFELGRINESFSLYNKISQIQEKEMALSFIAEKCVSFGKPKLFLSFLLENSISPTILSTAIRCFRTALVDTHGSIDSIRESLQYAPFDIIVAYNAAYSLVISHLQEGNMNYAVAIAEKCPQLGLEAFLTDQESRVLYSYEAYENWIDSITDEKQRTKIETWAEMVKEDEISEDLFRSKVETLISLK
jgi:hypothetical protein